VHRLAVLDEIYTRIADFSEAGSGPIGYYRATPPDRIR